MGTCLFSQEIIEHILQFADGKTLLACTDVSSSFAAAVKYLHKKRRIWKKLYFEEMGQSYPYSIIAKLYPHNEAFNFKKNWSLIYQSCLFVRGISNKERSLMSYVKVAERNSEIHDVQTHGNLILVQIKYNKNVSTYYRIITLNTDNVVIDKSCKFHADVVYITSLEDSSNVRSDAILLCCEVCKLIAVPAQFGHSVRGFPKFRQLGRYLTVEHSNGYILWFNKTQRLLTRVNCFHAANKTNLQEIRKKDKSTVKTLNIFANLILSCEGTQKVLHTLDTLNAYVTASTWYSSLMILGTDTGMLYLYHLNNESDLKTFKLESYVWHFNVCSEPILAFSIMELTNYFVIVCCTSKRVYQIRVNRDLKEC